MTPLSRSTILTALFIFVASQVAAHTGEGINTGFASGFWHPILGWDHVVAMVAVGLWGAFLWRARDLDTADRLSAWSWRWAARWAWRACNFRRSRRASRCRVWCWAC